jgi:type VI secretion system protein ImpA
MFQLPLQRLAEFSGLDGGAQDGDEPPILEAQTRADAVALMTQVAAYYGRTEPSSPIPFLIERARALAGRDFLSILKDILPENTLRNPSSGAAK